MNKFVRLLPEKREGYKTCPSCNVAVLSDQGKRIISRSSGKETISFRCFACIKKRTPAR